MTIILRLKMNLKIERIFSKMNDRFILKYGQVESVDDEYEGLRIKARIAQDGSTLVNDIPWAFPLLPKTFQSQPKVGEGVIIILADASNKVSDRFYIGPIISQPQYQEECLHRYGRGATLTFFNEKSSLSNPLESITHNKDTNGAFPEKGDVAVVGRSSQDVILKTNKEDNTDEVDIRCGIRKYSESGVKDPNGELNGALAGKIIFNKIDPAYIQLKYGNSLVNGQDRLNKPIDANSVVNILADRINIISGKDESLNINTKEQDGLIKSSDLKEMMTNLHQVPLGDKLVEFLDLLLNAFLTHCHAPYYLMPNYGTFGMEELMNFDTRTLLSEYVRIS